MQSGHTQEKNTSGISCSYFNTANIIAQCACNNAVSPFMFLGAMFGEIGSIAKMGKL